MVKTCQRISETLGKFIDDSLLLTIDFWKDTRIPI